MRGRPRGRRTPFFLGSGGSSGAGGGGARTEMTSSGATLVRTSFASLILEVSSLVGRPRRRFAISTARWAAVSTGSVMMASS